MNAKSKAEESTAHMLDSTDSDVGTHQPVLGFGEFADGFDDERFERDCAVSTKDVFPAVKHLEGYVHPSVISWAGFSYAE